MRVLALVVVLATAFPLNDAVKEVCCSGGVCYNDNPPFNGLPLPACGELIGVGMHVYTRSNVNSGQAIMRNSIPAVFNGAKKTMFFTHGWMGSNNNNWLHDMKDAALSVGDYNVIIVGWQSSSQQLWYPQSASDTRSVGTEIGLVAANLIANGGSARSRLYCIGHSLGGHVCGHAGQRTKFGRITGMDPAGPLFENREWSVGLNPSCADLVDVMHTNGQASLVLNLGTMKQLGHVDFYPNGGGTQPECILDPLLADNFDSIEKFDSQVDLMPACSHMRALNYYLESIKTPCFNSRHICNSTSMPASCTPSPTPVQTMGFNADQFSARGLFYLETKGKSPFCMG